MAVTIRQIGYAFVSFCVGLYAFVKVNQISGPAFEPIIAACSNSEISVEDFAIKTGYHAYDSRVGLGVLNVLVCLITQFLLELRETYPAGFVVWNAVMVVALPVGALMSIEAGRSGARGPIRYGASMGLLAQVFGISVMFPMVWVPSFVLGEGKRGAPLTLYRVVLAGLLTIPGMLLTLIVFSAPTNSDLWTTSAGTLGGPILPMFALLYFRDGSDSLIATQESTKECSRRIKKVFQLLTGIGFVHWYIILWVAYQSYGMSFESLWRDIWVDANASVAFMTIDSVFLYFGVLFYVAYRSDEMHALKTMLLTPFVGPAAATFMTMIEIEDETKYEDLVKDEEVKKEQ